MDFFRKPLRRRRQADNMENNITYECKKCGKSFVVSVKGDKHLVPLYCCGEEVAKSKKKKPPVKKNK